MSKNRRKKNRKPLTKQINCFNCNHCTYIGEGDHICDMTNDVVIAEWVAHHWDGEKWIFVPYDEYEHATAHCSVCNKRALLNFNKESMTSNFCPNCGAKMKGGAE